MKKNILNTLAKTGIAAGMIILSHTLAHAAEKEKSLSSKDFDVRDSSEGNMNYHLMTDDELMLELTPEGQSIYNRLNTEGKALARYVASQNCNGTNGCEGLNACATDDHACAGKGKCKGTGKCAFSDKNLAVKLVWEKMAQKRLNAQKS